MWTELPCKEVDSFTVMFMRSDKELWVGLLLKKADFSTHTFQDALGTWDCIVVAKKVHIQLTKCILFVGGICLLQRFSSAINWSHLPGNLNRKMELAQAYSLENGDAGGC